MPQAADRAAERGFTLIEIIVVLVILGLVAGLVLARGPQRSAAVDMRQASGMVVGALRVARSRAIATNRPVPVRFAVRALQIGDDPARTLPSGIALATNEPVLLFRPDGSSSGGAVQLSSASRTAQVDVNWLTGRVAVVDSP